MSESSVASTATEVSGKASGGIKVLMQIALVALVMYLTFGVLIPSFAPYDEIWAAMTSVSFAVVVVIVALQLVNQCGQALVPAMLVKTLKFRWSLVADSVSTVVSNVIPGPSGTAARYAVYRSYGVDAVDFGRSTVANSILNNAVLLMMPLIALLLIAVGEDVQSRVWILAIVAAVIAVLVIVLTMVIMRSERATRVLARWTERLTNPVLRLLRREQLHDTGDRLAGFREESLSILQQKWKRLLLVLVSRYLLNTVMLTICMHQVGVPNEVLPYGVVFAVYAFTRLLTFIEITPGGVGVTEAVYIYLFSIVTFDRYDDEVVGGVFLFRAATYLVPTIIGSVALLWWRWTQRSRKPAGEFAH